MIRQKADNYVIGDAFITFYRTTAGDADHLPKTVAVASYPAKSILFIKMEEAPEKLSKFQVEA